MIFTRPRVSHALLSLRKNGGLLVVYDSCGSSVRYKPNKDNITNGTVTINGLPPGSFLKFRVYSVSDFSEHVKDRDKWNYDTVLVRTKGK